ncbi:MAG: Rieske 2Fe-2S domain-containing protein [Gammaproteobacteria bacterium]|nr:Rieske 2Fe-2S domain-containing protein [Gammaproteobacteria bacterium]
MPTYPALICAATLLEDNQSLRFQYQQQTGILVRHQGQLRAYINRCPHRHKTLGDGPDFFDDQSLYLRCEHHQALFSIDTGVCIAGPCKQQRLTSIAIAEREGNIWLLDWPCQSDRQSPA